MTDTIYKVTIEMIVIADEGERDPRLWHNDRLAEHLLDHPGLHLSTTSEVATFGAEQKTEPATEPTPEPAQVLELEPRRLLKKQKHGPRVNGKRPRRTRKGESVPGLRRSESVYFSHDYRNASKHLDIGTHSTRDGRKCVWLTGEEACMVNTQVMERRAQREARRAASGGE